MGGNLPVLSIHPQCTLTLPPTPGHPFPIQQQNQLQPLSHAPPVPLTPRPAGLVGAGATGLLALSGALAAQAQLVAAVKEDRVGVDTEGSRGEWAQPSVGGRVTASRGCSCGVQFSAACPWEHTSCLCRGVSLGCGRSGSDREGAVPLKPSRVTNP